MTSEEVVLLGEIRDNLLSINEKMNTMCSYIEHVKQRENQRQNHIEQKRLERQANQEKRKQKKEQKRLERDQKQMERVQKRRDNAQKRLLACKEKAVNAESLFLQTVSHLKNSIDE